MTNDDIADITGAWDYRGLPENIVFGRDCWFERKQSFKGFRSEQHPGLIIGDRVRIYTWATFNVEPSGMVLVGDDSILVGPVFMCSCTIDIGRRVVISYHVTIADSDFHPVDPDLRKQDAIANSPYGDRSRRPAYSSRPVVIEDDVWIGIGAIILKGVTIGQRARIGAGSVVTTDVAPDTEVCGNPARVSPLHRVQP
jgi:acetyltransferase-like isoleucine patch superfamily enzyme